MAHRRSSENRVFRDHYASPTVPEVEPRRCIVSPLLPLLPYPRNHRVLDVCSGRGALLRVVQARWPWAKCRGVEIDPMLARDGRRAGLHIIRRDVLVWRPAPRERAGLIIANPPFNLWTDIVEICLEHLLAPGGTIAILTPSTYTEGVETSRDHVARRDRIWQSRAWCRYDLRLRPRFNGAKSSDMASFFWAAHGPLNEGKFLRIGG